MKHDYTHKPIETIFRYQGIAKKGFEPLNGFVPNHLYDMYHI